MRAPEIRPGIRRLFRLAAQRDVANEADDEIRLHLQLRTDQLIRDGFTPAAARAEAERLFGSVDEERIRMRARSRRRESRMRLRDWVESVGQDVRYALRTLRRDAAFTLFAILIVSLGIGATTTMFSLVNGVLLRPLPFRDPARLVWISTIGNDGVAEWRIQSSHFADMAVRAQTMESIAGYDAYFGIGRNALSVGTETQRLTAVPVTCNFFPTLGVALALGRSFTADECTGSGPSAVVLTNELWRVQFGSDRGIIGRVVTIDNAPATVIGVLPPAFDFASVFVPGTKVDLFSAFPLNEENGRRGNTMAVVGRVKRGASIEAARSELVSLGKQLSAEFPRRNALRPKVLPLDERVNGSVRPALFVLGCAVFAVMLIVTANLSSLQFARMASRQRETAVRLALGAARGRLIRQTLTESLVLTMGAAVLGILAAVLGTRLVSRLDTFDIPLLARVGVDIPALVFATTLAVVTGVVIGVLPALNTPEDVQNVLKDSARGSTRGGRHTRVRAVLVVSEIAVACVLLVGAGLLVRSFVRVLDRELGFRPDRVAALRVDPPTQFATIASANAYYAEVLRRVRAVPGVKQAGLSDLLPFAGDRSWGVVGEGQIFVPGQSPEAFIRVVTGGYFGAMGIPIKAGRDFTEGDSREAPSVAIVNETLARKLWPGLNPVGQNIMNGKKPVRVIALVGDVRHDALEGAFTGELYFSMRQFIEDAATNLVVKTDLSPEQLTSSVRAALAPVAPEASKNQWRPLQQLIDRVASPRRFVVLLLGGFSAFALLLAALGIYALVSYGVSQRTQEIGVRMALGASAADLRATVMGRTLQLAGIGIAVGAGVSIVLARAIRGLLFGVTWSDPVSFVSALALLVLVALAGGYFPARRASRVDPSVALREG